MMPANSLTFIGRQDFIWGISGHHKGYAAYPEEYLEEQIQKAAGLGVDVYRLNYSPETSEDFAYLDRVLDLCDANGLRLFLILFDRKFTKDGLTSRPALRQNPCRLRTIQRADPAVSNIQ